MKYALVSPHHSFGGSGTILARGELVEMEAQRQPGQHIVYLSHDHMYRYDVGGECLYAWYGGKSKPYQADGVTVYVDTSGT